IEDLRRGTWPGSLLPRPPACQNFFEKLSVERRFRRAGEGAAKSSTSGLALAALAGHMSEFSAGVLTADAHA
ncbi:MAG: hypothetical protein SOT76_10070, partial [Eubacteriales bacterium]|nr:hypothetical protein [Eubacteriales bacterium]